MKIKSLKDLQKRKDQLRMNEELNKIQMERKVKELTNFIPFVGKNKNSSSQGMLSKVGFNSHDLRKGTKAFMAAVPFSTFVLPRLISVLPIKRRWKTLFKIVPIFITAIIPAVKKMRS